jgi:hypothetical protein
LTALDLLGKAEARVAELEAGRDEALASMERYFDKRDEMYLMDAYRTLTALAAVRQEKAMSERVPEFVYAESREQAQEVLDESYLTKYEAHPVGTGARVAELEAELEKLVAVERAARTQDIHGLFAALAAVRQEKP